MCNIMFAHVDVIFLMCVFGWSLLCDQRTVLGQYFQAEKCRVTTFPPLKSPPLARDGLPGGGGGGGRQVMVSQGEGGGEIARVFRGKVWCPPMMQANRTRVDGHPRQKWDTGDVLGGWGSSTSRPKASLIWTLSHP